MLTNQLIPFQSDQVAICNGDSFNFDGFNQKFISHLLQLDLFAYPIQQKHLKRGIKVLISQQSLPFQAFHTIFPQIVEITKQKDKLDLVFELFRQFAENPSGEICGRFYWIYYKEKHLEDYKAKKCFLDITRCMVTRDALVSSIFGIDSLKLQRLTFDIKNKNTLENAWLKIQKNSSLLKFQPDNFIAYSFGISAARAFPGHAFLIIQYLNKQGELEYRIFQSYLGEFCLKGYLEKHNNIFSSEEFILFLEGLQECLLADKWTHSLEMFYVKYFNVKKGFTIGDVNPCKAGDFGIEWGIGCLVDILIQKKKFEVFKTSPEFPKIEASGSSLFEQQIIESKKEQSPEALVAKKLRLEKLDKKLRDIYEKNAPITAQERIKVDLDSLALELAEEGQIDVPARDEKGELIIEENDEVRWIERTITLETATKDVIAELNNLIQNNINQKSKIDNNFLLLNTNKEPFRTYNRLGVPLDKFYLSEEEEKQLWLPRIINALVSKGYISKLDRVNGHGYFIEV